MIILVLLLLGLQLPLRYSVTDCVKRESCHRREQNEQLASSASAPSHPTGVSTVVSVKLFNVRLGSVPGEDSSTRNWESSVVKLTEERPTDRPVLAVVQLEGLESESPCSLPQSVCYTECATCHRRTLASTSISDAVPASTPLHLCLKGLLYQLCLLPTAVLSSELATNEDSNTPVSTFPASTMYYYANCYSC
jgi:hypothetical protein